MIAETFVLTSFTFNKKIFNFFFFQSQPFLWLLMILPTLLILFLAYQFSAYMLKKVALCKINSEQCKLHHISLTVAH